MPGRRMHIDAHMRGQSLLELAICVPIFIAFFCGVVDLGYAGVKNVALVSATEDMAEAIQIDPSLINDNAACVEYVKNAFPSNLEPKGVRVELVPKTGMQELTYDYHLWTDATTPGGTDEFRSRATKFRFRDYELTVVAAHDFVTPIGAAFAWLTGMDHNDFGTDFSAEKMMRIRVDGALAGENLW